MRKVSILVFVLATIWSMSALAAPPLLPVQGRLLDSGGQPVNDAQIVVFRVYDAPVGGTHIFEETQLVQFSDGYFVAYMGENPPLPLTMFDGAPELWLGVKVGDDAEMTPRLRLGAAPSAPFANTCGDAETLGALGADDFAKAKDLNAYSLTSHAHAGVYALTSHPHTGYATTSHPHTGYADDAHAHAGVYAPTSHPHTGYADDAHLHVGVYAPNAHGHVITSADIFDGTIASVDLANDAVTSAKLTDRSVGADDLALDSIGSEHLRNRSVGADQLGLDTVGSEHLRTGSVGSSEIANGQVVWADLGLTTFVVGVNTTSAGGTSGQALNDRCTNSPDWIGGTQTFDALICALTHVDVRVGDNADADTFRCRIQVISGRWNLCAHEAGTNAFTGCEMRCLR